MSGHHNEELLKLLVIGDSGAGKSSMLLRYADDTFSNNLISTIGVDFKVKYMKVNENPVKLQIWDTAGQERFRTITTTYYRGTHGIIAVFDLTVLDSFQNIARWNNEIQDQSEEDVAKILVGNKSDLESSRQVTTEQAQLYAKELGMDYFEVSAKTGANIEQSFARIAQLAYAVKHVNQKPTGAPEISIQNNALMSKKKKCC